MIDMNEWTVVVTIGVLITLMASIVKPIISLTRAITQLTVTVDNLKSDIASFTEKNSESHARLWEHNKLQDEKLQNHGDRIIRLEEKK